MPVYTCSFAALDDTVTAIEATAELIRCAFAANDDTVVIITSKAAVRPAKGIERR